MCMQVSGDMPVTKLSTFLPNSYDLKTATRLYVLDANAPETAAISFSPDGRRLVTASLLGHKMTVWKVGTSFSSVFSIGAPPRQGTKRGQPYKVIDFALSESGQWRYPFMIFAISSNRFDASPSQRSDRTADPVYHMARAEKRLSQSWRDQDDFRNMKEYG